MQLHQILPPPSLFLSLFFFPLLLTPAVASSLCFLSIRLLPTSLRSPRSGRALFFKSIGPLSYLDPYSDPLIHDPPIFSPPDPPRIFVSAQTRSLLSLLSSPSFGPSLSRPLSLSLFFSLSLLSPSRRLAHVHDRPLPLSPSHRLSPLQSGEAAPLAARKKGGPKRTSYFLCSDSDLGGPKWPPMM